MSRITIPLEHVLGAEEDQEIVRRLMGGCWIPIRRVPGVRFYNVHGHREKTVVIRLKDERYDTLVTEVNDPAAVVAQVNQAGSKPNR